MQLNFIKRCQCFWRRALARSYSRFFLPSTDSIYTSLIENLDQGVLVIQDNQIVFVNVQACKFLRSTAEKIVGTNLLDWIHLDDRLEVSALQQKALKKPQIKSRYKVRLVVGDGAVCVMDCRDDTAQWGHSPAVVIFLAQSKDHGHIEEALMRSEERYRAVIEHVNSGMVVVQNDQLVYANRRAAEIMRMTPDSILNLGFLHSIHPDDRAIVLDRLQRRLAGEEVPNSYEIRLLFDDGSLAWLELGVSVVPWNGQPATITFYSDVTERKKIALALARSEERYRAVVEHSGEGMLVVQDGKFVFANYQAAHLLEMSSEEILREGYLHRVHPQDRALVDERRRRRLAGDENLPNRYEIRIVLPQDRVRWIDIGVTIVPWDGLPGTLTFFSDVTERKQAEEDLTRTSSELDAILNSALVGIVLSVNQRHQWVNKKFSEMVGYSREELINPLSFNIHDSAINWEQGNLEQRAQLLATGTFTNEQPLKRRNGDFFWVLVSGQCVHEKNPDSGVIWTFLDISDRIKAEQNTRAALEQQRELNDLRSRFVAMTSHEFRTPLASILSSSELLRYYSDRMPPEEKIEIIETIEKGVHRITRMLDRVLLLGKAEAHMLDFSPQPLDLNAVCQSIVDEVCLQRPNEQCRVVTRFSSAVLQRPYDEKLLRHIFGNLLSNALKYSPHGGDVIFDIHPDGDQTIVTVSDRGIGIPAEEMGHLFESFHRASNVGDIGGTGLGLAIVKNAVDLHRGTIHVESKVGHGTSFRVCL